MQETLQNLAEMGLVAQPQAVGNLDFPAAPLPIFELDPGVVRLQFGDDYNQRRAHGIGRDTRGRFDGQFGPIVLLFFLPNDHGGFGSADGREMRVASPGGRFVSPFHIDPGVDTLDGIKDRSITGDRETAGPDRDPSVVAGAVGSPVDAGAVVGADTGGAIAGGATVGDIAGDAEGAGGFTAGGGGDLGGMP